jgi:hypothetical protein
MKSRPSNFPPFVHNPIMVGKPFGCVPWNTTPMVPSICEPGVIFECRSYPTPPFVYISRVWQITCISVVLVSFVAH